jgi:hypothetical protein
VYLLLYPSPGLAGEVQRDPEAIDRLFDALSEVAANRKRGGRVYGGGLNKIEPRELEAIELPLGAPERYEHLRQRQLQQRGLFPAAGPATVAR